MNKVSNLEDELMDTVHNAIYTNLTQSINLLGEELLTIPMGEERHIQMMKTVAERTKKVFCTYVDGLVTAWSYIFKIHNICEQLPLKVLKICLTLAKEDEI